MVAGGVDNTREIPELAGTQGPVWRGEGVRRDDLEDFWHVPVLETWAEAFSGKASNPEEPPSVINSSQALPCGETSSVHQSAGGDLSTASA